MIKGLHFKLTYNIIANPKEDKVGYFLEKSYIDKLDIETHGIGFNSDGYYVLFSNDEAHVIDNKLVYIEKSQQRYTYYPNKSFGEYYFMSWDIDDFGDDDEGWINFHDACEIERTAYDNAIEKVVYEGFIGGDDVDVIEDVLAKVVEEFCKENEIN